MMLDNCDDMRSSLINDLDELSLFLEKNGIKRGTEEQFSEQGYFNFEISGIFPKRDITVLFRSLLDGPIPLYYTAFYNEDTHIWAQMVQEREGMARCQQPAEPTFETFKNHIVKIVNNMKNEADELKTIDGFGTCASCVFPRVIDGSRICGECEDFGMYRYIERCLPPEQLEVVTNEFTGKPLARIIKNKM